MFDVAVIGVGQTCYGMFPERTLKELFHEAAVNALSDVDKGLNPLEVEEAYIHCAKHIPHLKPLTNKIIWGTDDERLKGGDFFGTSSR